MKCIRTILFLFLLSFQQVSAQTDSTLRAIQDIPTKYIGTVEHKIDKYSSRISSKTEKTLTKLSRWENKIKNLLGKTSPETATRLFANKDMTFTGLLEKLKQGQTITNGYKAQYNEYRDKLTTSLKYIETQKTKLDSTIIKPLQKTKGKMDELEQTVANSEAIEAFIKERKKQLIESSLQYIGKSKYLQKINKESYYYVETLKNYKEIFSDPKKAEQTAKEILSKIPAFKKFAEKNSMLASLFGTPTDYGSAASLAGLQTRASVNGLIADRLASGGPNARELFSQNLQQAQSELNALKDKVLKAAGSSSDANIPDFKPNPQRSKTFFQRLEYGTNLQFAKTNNLLPSTADIGLSVGYKLNDKSTAGIGLSYKMGMGSIRHISITHQGVGLRSFIDWKLKKQFYISGGFEVNHNAGFSKIAQLKDRSAWQEAGLIGITKKMQLKTKLVKNTQIQLLYDILYREHVPASQPVLFRVGYGF